MKKLQNSLYIMTQGSYLHKERETICLRVEGEQKTQIPAHQLNEIHCFGNVSVSPYVMGMCGERNISLSFYSEYGKFLARIQGKQTGNILLRQQQYGIAQESPINIASTIIAAKIQASRNNLMRHQRNHGNVSEIEKAVAALKRSLYHLQNSTTLDEIRGYEGEAASQYFSVFHHLIQHHQRDSFPFDGRIKRPPTDPVNAMLSFLYAIIGSSISGSLQGVGLDPQMGFLHQPRSGRDSLALDILEEFRAWLADRTVLTLINRQQVQPSDFQIQSSGAVVMKDDTRKLILKTLQERKQETIEHPFLQEKIPIGIVFHVQALLLARHIRGDLKQYPAFLMR